VKDSRNRIRSSENIEGKIKWNIHRAGFRQRLLLHVLKVDFIGKILNNSAHLLYLFCGSGTGARSGLSCRIGAGSGSCLSCWEVRFYRIEKHFFVFTYLATVYIKQYNEKI
jgi:hypothetical protein